MTLETHSNDLQVARFPGSFGEAVQSVLREHPHSYVYLASLDGAFQPTEIVRACKYMIEHQEGAHVLRPFLESVPPYVRAERMTDIIASVGTGEQFEEWFPAWTAFTFHSQPPNPTSFVQLPLAAVADFWMPRSHRSGPPLAPLEVSEWMRRNECFKLVASNEFIGVISLADNNFK